MAAMDKRDPSRQPQSFREEFLASNYTFRGYRLYGSRELGWSTLASNRTAWANKSIPRTGQSEIREARTRRSDAYPALYRLADKRFKLSDPQKNEPDNITVARTRWQEATAWFTAQGPFRHVSPLGYGGLGLTIRFQYQNPDPTIPPRDIVLKIGLRGWISHEIDAEERSAKVIRPGRHIAYASSSNVLAASGSRGPLRPDDRSGRARDAP